MVSFRLTNKRLGDNNPPMPIPPPTSVKIIVVSGPRFFKKFCALILKFAF